MRPRDLADLLGLAALWGAAFLFMRMGAGQFGPLPLAGLRVAGGALVLLPLMLIRGEGEAMRTHWKPLLILGITTSAFPFACYSYAALTLNAGLSSIFNAASPLFAGLIAWFWLKDRLSPLRVLGLVIGFTGVFGLVYAKTGLSTGAGDMRTALAVGACVLATISYGYSANYTKRYLTGVPLMAVAAGTQTYAALLMAVPTIALWPETTPTATAWASLAALAIACTGLAYILYFRLIANVGPSNAIAVTFLIPAFAVAWGAMFLGEAVTPAMVVGCAVILIGTALATGLVKPRAVHATP